MKKEENRRVLMTKRLLTESFLTLLKKENIHKISIRELCELADINRSTFYKHYGSQYDLLREMENEIIDQIKLAVESTPAGGDTPLLSLLKYALKNREIILVLVSSNVDKDFPREIFSLSILREAVQKQVPNLSTAEYDYLYEYVIYGAYQTLIRWLTKEQRETPEEIAAILFHLIQQNLQGNE